MDKNSKKIFLTIAVLGFLGIIISYILTYEHYITPIVKDLGYKQNFLSKFTAQFCGSDQSIVNCDKVAQSKYSTVGKTPVALYGLFFFFIITFFSISIFFIKEKFRDHFKLLLFWFVLFGSLYDLYLLFLSIFVIKAICIFCIATYIFLWASFIILLLSLQKSGPKPFSIITSIKNIIFDTDKKSLLYYSISIIIIVSLSLAASSGVNVYVQKKRVTVESEAKEWILNQISKYFFKSKKWDIGVAEPALVGKKDAPITIVKFSDFLCPTCRKTANILNQFVSENPNLVKMYFINFPLDSGCNDLIEREIHPGACLLAKGAICANRQEKFHQYSGPAFNLAIKKMTADQLEGLVALTKIDLKEFNKCIADPSVTKELESQVNEGIRVGVKGTPSIFINGKFYNYSPVKEILKKIVEDEYRMMDMKKFMRDGNNRN